MKATLRIPKTVELCAAEQVRYRRLRNGGNQPDSLRTLVGPLVIGRVGPSLVEGVRITINQTFGRCPFLISCASELTDITDGALMLAEVDIIITGEQTEVDKLRETAAFIDTVAGGCVYA